jgi:hypothetical protein
VLGLRVLRPFGKYRPEASRGRAGFRFRRRFAIFFLLLAFFAFFGGLTGLTKIAGIGISPIPGLLRRIKGAYRINCSLLLKYYRLLI